MTVIEAIILAIIEGITEYLPISSTGHMIIASSFMGIEKEDFTKLFTVAIQLGAIMSVIVLYWRRFIQSVSFYKKLFIAFLPAVILGLLLGDWIDSLLENPVVVAINLLIGGFVLLKIDKWFHHPAENQDVTYKKAFIIGLYQCLAMLPGVSRSAASIIGGMTQKLNRTNAAEFSFFLAVPTMLGATLKKMFDYYAKGYFKQDGISFSGFLEYIQVKLTTHDIMLLTIGNVVAFIVALIAIKTFIAYLGKHGFQIFGYYRIFIGILLLIIHFFIHPLNTF